uniref:Immunoglobulin domain-containing protein n=1 Tax=Cyprinus carpio TaxID=7962 RepID=A0A8C2CB65_CYPCA
MYKNTHPSSLNKTDHSRFQFDSEKELRRCHNRQTLLTYSTLLTEQLKKMFHIFVLFCMCWWRLIGVFGESLSVTEGDSVTLHIGVTEIHEDDDILWKFGAEKSQIAKIKKKKQNFSIYDDVLDGRFRDKLKLDNQTGSLTITNITTQHTGDYQLEMSGAKKSSKTFSVSVYGEQRSGVGSTGP